MSTQRSAAAVMRDDSRAPRPPRATRRARSGSRCRSGRKRDRRPRFNFHRAWFSELPQVLAIPASTRSRRALRPRHSSPQIDDPGARLLAARRGPLDMRMDPARGESVADFLARADVRELTEVIRDYGEERFAQSVARAIVAARAVAPVVRTRQLAGIVAQASARARGVIGVRIRPRGPSRLSEFTSIGNSRNSR